MECPRVVSLSLAGLWGEMRQSLVTATPIFVCDLGSRELSFPSAVLGNFNWYFSTQRKVREREI